MLMGGPRALVRDRETMATGGDVQPQGRFPPHGTICEILQLDGVHVFATPGFCHRASGGDFWLRLCFESTGRLGSYALACMAS